MLLQIKEIWQFAYIFLELMENKIIIGHLIAEYTTICLVQVIKLQKSVNALNSGQLQNQGKDILENQTFDEPWPLSLFIIYLM